MLELNYYSFLVGMPYQPQRTWGHLDHKIPAYSPKEALILHNFFLNRCNPDRSNPNKDQINIFYRRIIEYKLMGTVGKTRFNFKEIKIYTSHEFINWF